MSRRRPDDEDEDAKEQFQERKPAAKRPQPPSRPEDDEEEDERPRRRSIRHRDDDDDSYSGIVPYRNIFALVAYYMGFLGLIAILGGFALAISGTISVGMSGIIIFGLGGAGGLMGLVFGGIGLSKASKGKGTAHAVVGMVLGVLEILGLLLMLLGVVAIGGR